MSFTPYTYTCGCAIRSEIAVYPRDARPCDNCRTKEAFMPESTKKPTPLTEEEKGRLECECIFGLTGGELQEEKWEGHAYWYEGCPEWATDHFTRDERSGADLRTVIVSHPWEYKAPAGWWIRRFYVSGTEASCSWCGDGTGNEHTRESCQLCDGDGFVYWGEEWGEVVLEQPTHENLTMTVSAAVDTALCAAEDTGTAKATATIVENAVTNGVFLGSEYWEAINERVDLYAIREGNADSGPLGTLVARWGDEAHEVIAIPANLAHRNVALQTALPWLKEAGRRYDTLEKE